MSTPPPIEDVIKPRRSGLTTLLYVLIGGGGLLCLTCGVGAFLFLRSEEGKRMVEGVREATTLYTEAAGATGSAELRELGCDIALVSTVGRIQDLGRAFQPAELAEGEEADPAVAGMAFTLCQIDGINGPSCAEVARTYGRVVAAVDPFMVAVVRSSGEDEQCNGVYTADGSLVRAVE